MSDFVLYMGYIDPYSGSCFPFACWKAVRCHMKKLGFLLLGGALVFVGVTIFQLWPDKDTETVSSLVAQEAAAGERCRGGAGDDPDTQKACELRDGLVVQLKRNGWCYGTEEQAEYQKRWQKCSADNQELSPQKTPSDEIQFNQTDDDKKEMLRQMEVGMADCSDRLVRGLLRQGERSKSRIASYTATTCGQGLKRFLVMHSVPAGVAEKYAEMIAWKALQNVVQ